MCSFVAGGMRVIRASAIGTYTKSRSRKCTGQLTAGTSEISTGRLSN
ncbi:hypothetical protein [Ruegeria sp. ANG-R]